MELDFIGQDLALLEEVPWEQAERCEKLSFHFNRLSNLRGFPPLQFLYELNLSSNHFKTCHLPELTRLPCLSSLDLSGNSIKSLSDFPYLPALRNLSVAFNFIVSVDGIGGALVGLEQLDMRGNQISESRDLDALAELSQLRALFIGGPQQNPVCNRVPNLTRLFQVCESLTLIDNKTVGEWRNIQLLEAPTPRFDELLKSRSARKPSSSNPASSKKLQQQQQQQLRAAHTPATSKVLFPPRSNPRSQLHSRSHTKPAHHHSSGHPYEHHGMNDEYGDQEEEGDDEWKGRGRHRRREEPTFDFNDAETDVYGQSPAAPAPHGHRLPGHLGSSPVGSARTEKHAWMPCSAERNPWSVDDDRPPEHASDSHKHTPTMTPAGATATRSATASAVVAPPRTVTRTPLQVETTATSASPVPGSGAASPTKASDSEFRAAEHQLSLRLVASLMTLSAMQEKNAFVHKQQAFHAFKLHVLQKRQEKQRLQWQWEQDSLSSQLQLAQQEQQSLHANYTQRLADAREQYDALQFQLHDVETRHRDAQRDSERFSAERDNSEDEKHAILHELNKVKSALEETQLQLVQLQTREVQAKTQTHSLSQQLETAVSQHAVQLHQVETERDTWRRETEYCRHRIAANEDSLATYKQSVAIVQETMRAKEEALIIKEQEKNVLQQRVASLVQERDALIAQQDTSTQVLREEFAEAQQRCAQLQRQLEEMQGKRYESRLMTLQEAFDEVTQHNAQLHQDIARAREQHTQDRKVMKELSRVVKKLQVMDNYRNQQQQVCLNCGDLQSQLEDQRSSHHDAIERLQQQLSAEVTQRQQLHDQLSCLKTQTQKQTQDLETAVQVKDIQLHDHRLQITELTGKLRASEEHNSEMQHLMEEYEEKISENKQDIVELEQDLTMKTRICQRMKALVRDFLHNKWMEDVDLDDEGDEDGSWNRNKVRRSLELLDSGFAQHLRDDDDSGERVDEDRHRRRSSKDKKPPVHSRSSRRYNDDHDHDVDDDIEESGFVTGDRMSDHDFLGLLTDIDGIAITSEQEKKKKQERRSSKNDRKTSKSRYGRRYDDDEKEEYEEEEESRLPPRAPPVSRGNSSGGGAKTSEAPNDGLCVSIRCQKERRALEQALQDALTQLTQQKIDFERKLQAKQEDYLRVSESLTRLEEKSKDLAKFIESEKERYEISVEKFKVDKKKLSRACRALEEELQRKNQELQETQTAADELQHAFASFQKLQQGKQSSTPKK